MSHAFFVNISDAGIVIFLNLNIFHAMITIVFSHPWHGSFNDAILQTITNRLDETSRMYQLIDLPADNFNPAMTQHDLRLYSRGGTADPLAEEYGAMLRASTEIIFIFPIWWGMMPAILKGFFDKVLLQGISHSYTNNGELHPLLNISRTLIITTSQGPTKLFFPFIKGYFIPTILTPVGMTGAEWHNCDNTAHGPQENREKFLRHIAEIV